MIVYKIDVLHELKQKGYSTYSLRKNKIMGEAQIQKIRQGELASKETLNTICRLLQIQPGDLLEYIDDDTNEQFEFIIRHVIEDNGVHLFYFYTSAEPNLVDETPNAN